MKDESMQLNNYDRTYEVLLHSVCPKTQLKIKSKRGCQY